VVRPGLAEPSFADPVAAPRNGFARSSTHPKHPSRFGRRRLARAAGGEPAGALRCVSRLARRPGQRPGPDGIARDVSGRSRAKVPRTRGSFHRNLPLPSLLLRTRPAGPRSITYLRRGYDRPSRHRDHREGVDRGREPLQPEEPGCGEGRGPGNRTTFVRDANPPARAWMAVGRSGWSIRALPTARRTASPRLPGCPGVPIRSDHPVVGLSA
jgi:hypothetical protein